MISDARAFRPGLGLALYDKKSYFLLILILLNFRNLLSYNAVSRTRSKQFNENVYQKFQ